MKKYVDRHGHPLQPGQKVTVQHCVGPYGQVAQVRGTLKQIGSANEVYLDTGKRGEGNCLYPGFTMVAETSPVVWRGYHRHTDFEHGHEQWIEIDSNSPSP